MRWRSQDVLSAVKIEFRRGSAVQDIPTWIPVVALALSDGAGRWLMHRRPAHKQHGALWEFPGGKVEAGETPRGALVREIGEELGIAIAASDLAPTGFADHGAAGAPVILLYTCTRWRGPPPRALEGGVVDWFTPTEIGRLECPPLDRQLIAALFG